MIDDANIMKKLAVMQTENRNYRQEIKGYVQKLLERDEEIAELKKAHEKQIIKLKDDIDFKNRMLKELRPKPKIRKVKNEN
jgi:glycerol-3-phosphate cytidylyltransferase-like family protein